MSRPTDPTHRPDPTGERADLIASLDRHRFFLRNTVRELTDEQACRRTTVSELTLAGLIKHVSGTESRWVDFILTGPAAMALGDSADAEQAQQAYRDTFRMIGDETLESLLARYEKVARRTDELIATIDDLGASQPLPEAPWFEPGARWSARRVALHIIAETAQHAGHADIIREALDGARSMG